MSWRHERLSVSYGRYCTSWVVAPRTCPVLPAFSRHWIPRLPVQPRHLLHPPFSNNSLGGQFRATIVFVSSIENIQIGISFSHIYSDFGCPGSDISLVANRKGAATVQKRSICPAGPCGFSIRHPAVTLRFNLKAQPAPAFHSLRHLCDSTACHRQGTTIALYSYRHSRPDCELGSAA